MTEPLLSEGRRWSGQWWLPDDPENKVSGALDYSLDDGIALTLVGGWEYRVLQHPVQGVTSVTNEMLDWPMIHGRAEGKFFTLLNSHVKRAQTFDMARMFEGGPDELVLGCATALVGCLLDAANEPAFEAAIVTVENLTAWSRQSGITAQVVVDEATGSTMGSIELQTVPSRRATSSDLVVNLHLSSWMPSLRPTRWGGVVDVRERASIEFASSVCRTVEDWVRLMSKVEDLVSLSALRACAILTMRVYLPPSPDSYPADHPLRMMRHEVEVYQDRILKPEPNGKSLSSDDFVLTLDDIDFDKLVPQWMATDEKFSAARSMILGLRYVSAGYLESKVVTAVAAAESMSRAMKPKPVMTNTELREVRAKALEGVPPERQQWVRERLTSAEPSLKDRLILLAKKPGAFMSDLVPNSTVWAESAANARNKIAHVGSPRHSADELYAVVEVTSAVVVMNFLHELGVPQDRMKRTLVEHPRLRAAVRLADEWFSGHAKTD